MGFSADDLDFFGGTKKWLHQKLVVEHVHVEKMATFFSKVQSDFHSTAFVGLFFWRAMILQECQDFSKWHLTDQTDAFCLNLPGACMAA